MLLCAGSAGKAERLNPKALLRSVHHEDAESEEQSGKSQPPILVSPIMHLIVIVLVLVIPLFGPLLCDEGPTVE